MVKAIPSVSVILCTYNRSARLLQAAVESILNQTFTDLELLVVDDGSSADPAKALAPYVKKDARLQLIRQANRGLAGARNTGIAKARGEYIAFQDDDDTSLPGRLAAQFAFLQQHPDVSSVSCQYENISYSARPAKNPHGKEVRIQQPKTALAHRSDFQHVILVDASALIRRPALAAVGGYRECLEAYEDLDLSLRLQEKFSLAMLPERYYQYHHHPHARISKSPDSWQYYCAVIASTWLRRNGDDNPLATGADISLAKLFALAAQTPSWLRRHFIWQARKLIKFSLRNREYENIEITLARCAELSQDFAAKIALKRLQFRLLLWSVWYGAPGYWRYNK